MTSGAPDSPITTTAGNRFRLSLLHPPVVGRFLGRGLTVLTYTGHKSGRVYRTPVGYQRDGDTVTLESKFGSHKKSWWRNFVGDGAPVTLLIDGKDRPGHAVAVVDGDAVTVTVTLQPTA